MDTNNFFMDIHLEQTIGMIELNSQLQLRYSEKILKLSSDYFAKSQASIIKSEAEDNLRMVAALRQLLKKALHG